MLLDFDELYRKYDLEIKGVLHIGAHFGQEYDTYKQYHIDKIVFFEPQSHVYHELKKRVGGFDQVVLENIALGSSAKNVDMYVENANNGMSSSLLRPKLHLAKYPSIQFVDKIKVNQITLDQYFKENINVNASDYNLINIDVQGYELEVFKGATSTLKNIDYIIAEVNKEELYENCARVNELDDFLSDFGFERIETKWEHQGWGDALYLKKENKKDRLILAGKHNRMIGIIFSKDRAMQLDATLKSFYMYCKDYPSVDLKVIYTSSDQYYAIQYRQLAAEYEEVDFIKEKNFKEDLLSNV
jgi:FkbM family methyltransferase